jgi:hypothetical protein
MMALFACGLVNLGQGGLREFRLFRLGYRASGPGDWLPNPQLITQRGYVLSRLFINQGFHQGFSRHFKVCFQGFQGFQGDDDDDVDDNAS